LFLGEIHKVLIFRPLYQDKGQESLRKALSAQSFCL